MRSVLFVALVLCTVCAALPAADDQLVIERINSSDFPKLRAIIQVERGGETVKGLGKEQFQVMADGQEITEFNFSTFFSSRQWLAIALAVDISGSMKGEALDNAKAAACDFINHTGVQDRLLLVAFDTQAAEIVPATTDKEQVKQALLDLQSQNNTALYDAIALASEKLALLPAPQKNLVLLTDGFDTSSAKSVSEMEKIVQAKKVTVYAIGLGKSVNEAILKKICDDSKGKYFNAATPAELTAIYRAIAKELQGSYCFEFTWPEAKQNTPGAAHTLEIQCGDQGSGMRIKNQFVPANVVIGSTATGVVPGPVMQARKDTPSTANVVSGFCWQKLFPYLYYGLAIGCLIALALMLLFKGGLLMNVAIFMLTELFAAIVVALWTLLR